MLDAGKDKWLGFTVVHLGSHLSLASVSGATSNIQHLASTDRQFTVAAFYVKLSAFYLSVSSLS